MKNSLIFFLSVLISLSFFSCEKNDKEDLVITDYFTYGKRFDFQEDSIKIGSGDWKKIDNGHILTFLGGTPKLKDLLNIPRGSATYSDRTNLKADFRYTILEDSVFPYGLSSDSLYFFDENLESFRTDLKGKFFFSPDTAIILHNTGVSPTISIKYIMKK